MLQVKFALAMAGVNMNDPRPVFMVRQGLRGFCFAVVVGAVLAGCQPSSSSSSSAAAAGGSTPTAAGTDTNSNVLGEASGGGGGSGFSVPVQASATGSESTVPFMVNDSTLNVTFTYDCSSTGGSGFTADMISGSAANPGSDDEGIADETGTGDSATVTVNLQATPGDYYLQVSSPCEWTIAVANG
jgi:hypothetical protein